MHQKVVAVDIDGTLNYDVDKPMRERRAVECIKETMRSLRRAGTIVILYTSRNVSRRTETLSWLFSHDIYGGTHYDDIVFGKLKYDAIIDTCAFNPIELILKELNNNETETLGIDTDLLDMIEELLACGG